MSFDLVQRHIQECIERNLSISASIPSVELLLAEAKVFCEANSLNEYFAINSFPFVPTKKILQDNTVYHGDCRQLIPLCKPNKPRGVITDFPYGIGFQSNQRKESPKFNKILNDEEPFVDQWIRESYRILPEAGFFISFYRWDVQDELFDEILKAGFKIKNQLVWDKQAYGMGDLEGSFSELHELAVFAVKGNYKFPKHAGRPANLYKSPRVDGANIIHPNQKPVNLLRAIIRDTTEKGDLIIEPFSGSGAVCEAAVLEERRVIGMELDNRKVEKIGTDYITWGNKRIKESMNRSSLF